ncbi:MAG: Rpn family recombination-promoting nuclease/putative transposase [Bacteroidota bacterium]
MVVYNGSQTHYPHHADLYEYFEHPELARSVMSKPYILANLSKIPDRELLAHGLCGPMELLLKRASDVNFVSWLQGHKALVSSHSAAPYLDQGLIYALEAGHGNADEIIASFVGIYPDLKESLMQAIRQIERRGEVRGIQQGMQQGRQEEKLGIARTMLHNLHLGADVVQQATGLSKQDLASL